MLVVLIAFILCVITCIFVEIPTSPVKEKKKDREWFLNTAITLHKKTLEDRCRILREASFLSIDNGSLIMDKVLVEASGPNYDFIRKLPNNSRIRITGYAKVGYDKDYKKSTPLIIASKIEPVCQNYDDDFGLEW